MMNKKGFTLVELIVVITILAILATVGFISFQGYGQSSRDAARLSDIASIEKLIQLYHVKNNNYPDPANLVNITYSGSTAWKQGIYGNTGNTNRAVLSDVPLDPITYLPYAYSVINTNQEYQIGAVFEGTAASNNIISNSYAGDQIAEVFVRGNYNGKIIKVDANSRTYILGVPSILASDITSVDIMDIINNNRLVYKGYNNLPASFSGSQYNSNGGFAFTPNQVVLFEGDISDLENNANERIAFLENLQTNYSGSILQGTSDFNRLLNIDIDNVTPDQNSLDYAAIILNDSIGTNISVKGGGINGVNTNIPGELPDIVTGLSSPNQSESAARVTWNPSNNATSYLVYVDNIFFTEVVGTQIDITGFSPNTGYNINVLARNSEGNSEPSGNILLVTAPPVPTNLSQVIINEGAIRFTWDEVPGATGFHVFRDNVFLGNIGNVTTFDLGGLMPNTEYSISLRSFSSPTASSSESLPLVFETAPPPITDLHVSYVSNDSIELEWTPVVGANEYLVIRGNTVLFRTDENRVPSVGLSENTTYGFNVLAYKENPPLSYSVSNGVNGTTAGTTLGTVQNVRVTDLTSTSARVQYDPLDGVENYIWYQNGLSSAISENGTFVIVDITELEPDTTHTFSVHGRDSTGGFSTRSEITFTTNP